MRDIGCNAFREQFVIYAWQTAPHGANYASPCCLDRLRGTKTARLGTPYCGALREKNLCQCEACLSVLRSGGRCPVQCRRRVAALTWTWLRRAPSVNSAMLKYNLIGPDLDLDVCDLELSWSLTSVESSTCRVRVDGTRP